eukprot:XP_011613476.1 PREDICTED: fetuin-B-like [Takifugu rubripes]
MKHRMLLSLLLALGCTHIRSAPVETTGLEAELALSKINQDRTEGYVFGLQRLSNVHMTKHGENGVVFYLTLDVVETNCSVLSKKDWKSCEIRPLANTPVYGQCKAAIFINKPHRVVRLYKYNCVVRPVPREKVYEICPDCPTLFSADDDQVKKTMTLSLEKFNKEAGMSKHFALLKFNRALVSMGLITLYNVEYTIQETICPKTTEAVTAEKCPLMDCEFAHKGFCKASLFIPRNPTDEPETEVNCEIYEPEVRFMGPRSHADVPGNSEHHHTHDHAAGSGHKHAHDHSHDHGHDHDHVHTHHAKAHDHSHDSPNHHHDYKHADGVHTHEHDHELALDHAHKHLHLHGHEHHHHHHDHDHEKEVHDHPEGMVRVLPAMSADLPMILPSFPDIPAGPEVGVVLPLKPDPQIPEAVEPTIEAFPTSLSAQCPALVLGPSLMDQMFTVDPIFKAAA